jgi:hypothetical protein
LELDNNKAEEAKVNSIAQKKTIQNILANDYLSEIEKKRKEKSERVIPL